MPICVLLNSQLRFISVQSAATPTSSEDGKKLASRTGYQTDKAGQDKTESVSEPLRPDTTVLKELTLSKTFLKMHTPTVDVSRHPTHHGRLTQFTLSDFQTTTPSLTVAIVLCHADVLEIEGPLLTMECKGLERLLAWFKQIGVHGA